MADLPNKIRITVGAVQLDAELKSTKTAKEVYAALPVESPVNTWGEEFYFKLAGVNDYRETATNQVKVGDVAFWGAGQVLAIFFGRTPMSMGPDPGPAAPGQCGRHGVGGAGAPRPAAGGGAG